MTHLKVEHLSFSYQEDIAILHDINLEFTKQSTAIIGQNGAGKTTFVKLLKGLLKPSSGRIFIHNMLTREMTEFFSTYKVIDFIFNLPLTSFIEWKIKMRVSQKYNF